MDLLIGPAVKPPSSRFRSLFDASLIALAAIVGLLASAQIALKPRDPANGVALVFAPWSDAESTFRSAIETGGRFIRFGGLPFIAVVMPEAPEFSQRVSASRAWFLADPKALAACLEAAGRKSL